MSPSALQPYLLSAMVVLSADGQPSLSSSPQDATHSPAQDLVQDLGQHLAQDLGHAGLSQTGHNVVAVFLGFILVVGFLSNFLVLLVFAKFRSLWTPINLILLNISLSDVLVCVFGTPFSFAASLYGRWLMGDVGCRWYGFANSLFGIVSLVSLAVLSYERYTTVLRCALVDLSDFRKAWLCILGSWLYSLLWTMPPFLGWSSYGPEGSGTTCSVQWHQRSWASVSYVLCLFIFCLLLPLLLMVYSYGHILVAIKRMGKINVLSAQRREQHILFMVLSMVSCYILCWMPYGVMALIATFGRSGTVTPLASIVPAILAKFSTVVNPVIYIFFNNQTFKRRKEERMKKAFESHTCVQKGFIPSRKSTKKKCELSESSTSVEPLYTSSSAMINTYQSSVAPPPVPPRLHSSHQGAQPVLYPTTVLPQGHSRTLMRFMVIVVLLNLLLSILGFMYLYMNHTPQRNQEMQSSYAVGGPELSMQKEDYYHVKKRESHRVFAQMEFEQPKKTTTLSGNLKWNIKHSKYSYPFINYYNSTWLTIEEPGNYFVYSRVTFSQSHSQIALTNKVQRRKTITDEPETVMQAFCYTDKNLCTATAEDVIKLEKGYQLSVWTEDVSQVSYKEKATTFGLYKL